MTTAVITGGSSGLGLAIAEQLLQNGVSRLFLCGRSQQRVNNAIEQLNEKNPAATIIGMIADQRELQQVHQLADELAEEPAIDILVNNAALCPRQRDVNAQGLEAAFTINYLSHFLLTQRLLPQLKKAESGRIVHLSSLALGGGQIDFENLQGELAFDGWQIYASTKLAIAWYSQMLAQKLAGTSVTSNCVCPGVVDTNLIVDHPNFPPEMFARLKPGMQPPGKAALLPVTLACKPELTGINGAFFANAHGLQKPMQIPMYKEDANRLWDLSMQWCEIKI